VAKRFRPEEEALETELNLVPYMDIMLNLIMFMLFSTTSLTEMGVINISLPQYGPSVVQTETDENKEPTVELTLAIGNEGFSILANGTEIDGHPGKPTLPRIQEGAWDYTGLTARMTQIKSDYPAQSTVVMVASEAIEYEVIVKAMDACRLLKNDQGERLLFPDVVLSVM
jgi:biopolymer transport protein TolR